MTRPSKIICIGRSYAEHARELGNAITERPVLFIKPPSSLTGLDNGIEWNSKLGSCHFECELTLRIDRTLKDETDPEKALATIGAVTIGLDLTMRDLQTELKNNGHPWERAKAFDGSCVLGSWVDASEIADWDHVTYQFYINDQLRQQGDTANLMLSLGEYLCDISQAFTVEAGDVIMTGTPAGVGALHAGDQLSMKLDGKTQQFTWNTFVKAD